jgi:hypothetical protein
MDMAAVSGAYAGLKLAKDVLQGVLAAKVAVKEATVTIGAPVTEAARWAPRSPCPRSVFAATGFDGIAAQEPAILLGMDDQPGGPPVVGCMSIAMARGASAGCSPRAECV